MRHRHRLSRKQEGDFNDKGKTSSTLVKEQDPQTKTISRRQLRFGWWSLLCFLSLGIFLESLHGFKVEWYLDVSTSTRRHMWTLAHAHGTILSILNLVFGTFINLLPSWTNRSRDLASSFLMAAGLILPMGFFLGGSFIYAGDPGLGILLVPLGAIFLLIAVLLTALHTKS